MAYNKLFNLLPTWFKNWFVPQYVYRCRFCNATVKSKTSNVFKHSGQFPFCPDLTCDKKLCTGLDVWGESKGTYWVPVPKEYYEESR